MRRLIGITAGTAGAALLGLLAASGVAQAWLKAGPNVVSAHHRLRTPGGVLDIGTAATAAYSFRLVRQAYLGTGASVRLRRASDNAESDIGFAGNGDWDGASATAFCATTTCFLRTWYDQSGNGRDLQQATAANQPEMVFNCLGVLPCYRETGNTHSMVTAAFTPATGLVSLSAVHIRVTGLGPCTIISENGGGGNRLNNRNTITGYVVTGNVSGNITAAGVEGSWHTVVGVVNGASSVLGVDGVETAGTVTGGVAAAGHLVNGQTTTTCMGTEAIVWDNYALTAAERTALTDNQRNYWLSLPLDKYAAATGAYSFRKLKTGYAGASTRIRRASDNLEIDIGFDGLGNWDGTSATAHCAATSCFIRTWYDQSGNGRDMAQATAASQPAVVLNCQGSLPCVETSVAAHSMISGSVTPATGIVTLNAVNMRVSGIVPVAVITGNGSGGNRLNNRNTNPGYILTGVAGGTVLNTSADGVWHSVTGVVNGASSVLAADGAEVTGTATGNVTAGGLFFAGGAATVTRQAEMVVWDNYVLTPAERTALTNNQRGYWGF